MIMMVAMMAAAPDAVAGEWRGTSLCQVRPSHCNDEQAVYQIERKDGGYLVHFGKVVGGKAEEFGTAQGAFDPETGRLVVIGHGRGGDFTWRFDIRGERLTGTLALPNGTIYRKADLSRVSR